MTVRFSSMRDIREFVSLATLQSYPIRVMDPAGNTADAKCFMEMFTVDFTKPLRLIIQDGQDTASFSRSAARFLAPQAEAKAPQLIK